MENETQQVNNSRSNKCSSIAAAYIVAKHTYLSPLPKRRSREESQRASSFCNAKSTIADLQIHDNNYDINGTAKWDDRATIDLRLYFHYQIAITVRRINPRY